MNLLPFVIVILTVLALFSSSHFDRHVQSSKEQESYKGYFRALRGARNKKETQAYNYNIRSQKSSNKSKKEKKVQNVPYFREEKVGWDNGRLNLYSLIDDPLKWPKLKEVAAAYIKQLYIHADFFPKEKNFPSSLIDALIVALKTEGLDTPLYELTLEEPYKTPFKHMLKGTQTYDLSLKGYPPFGNFFVFEKKEKPPMYFQDANLTFLSLTLGQKGMEALKKKELEQIEESGKHYSKIKRAELEVLLSFSPPDPAILDLFEFPKHSSPRMPAKFQDEETGITVHVP